MDKENATLSLDLTARTCTAALAALSQSNHDESHPSLAVLHTDLTSLLSLIYASTTKLSISLKPSSPTYQASLSPLKDLNAHISGIAHCVSLFHPDEHGKTLRKEMQGIVRDVIESVRELVKTFLRSSTTDYIGDEYLTRTGEIHDLIDRARDGMSTNNLEAVRKRWIMDKNGLEDGFREIGEIIEHGEREQDAQEEDDGWGELGLGESGGKMNKEELERTKKVHILLRLTTVLHNRILLDLLTPTASLASSQNLDTLLTHSSSLLSISDDLISTLYTSQDSTSVSSELSSFVEVVRKLDLALERFCPSDISLSASNVEEPGITTDKRKWFETCLKQIYKVAETLSDSLRHETNR